MANEIFNLDLSDFKKLKKFYKKAPKQFGRAAAGVLNDFAFGTRKESIETINRRMTVRNSKFISSSMRVSKARGSNIDSMQSESGSIRRKRFSGWEEQELGKRSSRTKIASKFGRGGSNRGVLKPSFRMKPSTRFMKPNDFPGATKNQKVGAMLQVIGRTKKRSRPFIITGSSKFASGLYKIQNKKIKRIQKFKSRKQPKRIKWHTEAKRDYFSSNNIRNVWAKNIRRVLRF